MRTTLALAIVSVLVAGAAKAATTYEAAGNTSCATFQANSRDFDFTDAIVQYLYGNGGGDLGSACNIVDYVRVECRRAPRLHVREAVTGLLGKVRRHAKLPTIPMCGA